METTFKPIRLTDQEIYEAIYLVGEELFVVKIDPSIKDVDTLTRYPSIEAYEEVTGNNLTMY